MNYDSEKKGFALQFFTRPKIEQQRFFRTNDQRKTQSLSIPFPLIYEFGVVVLTLFVLGMCGGWLLLPFRNKIPFLWLAAPQAGLLALAVGLSFCYNYGLTLSRAALLCIPCMCAFTIALCHARVFKFVRTQPRSTLLVGILVSLALCLFATRVSNAALVHSAGPAFLLMDGSDQIGYSQAADWVRTHPRTVMPQLNPSNPYTSWLVVVFGMDHRFGAFYLLGTASLFREHTGVFSFDFACAVALASGLLAVASICCATSKSFVLTIFGIAVSLWMDYSRTGYLGKILCYPSVLLVIGLCVTESNPLARFRFPALAFLCIGATICHSHLSVSFLLAMAAAGYPVAWCCLRFRWRRERWHQFLALGFLVLVANAASGLLSLLPANVLTYPDWDVKWPVIWLRIAEVESLGVRHNNLNPTLALCCLYAVLVLHGSALGLAIVKKSFASIALLTGPLVIALGLWLLDSRAAAWQSVGMFFPMFVAALALMLNDTFHISQISQTGQPSRWDRWVNGSLIAIAVLTVVIRLPYFYNSVERYCRSNFTHEREFSWSDFQKIQQIVASEELLVEVADPVLSFFVLAELGGRDMKLQWSDAAWNAVEAGRGWPVPAYPKPAKFRLVPSQSALPAGFQEVLQTTQFKLLRNTSQ